MDSKPTEYIVSDGKGGTKVVPAGAMAEYVEEAVSKLPVETEYFGSSTNSTNSTNASDGASSLAVAINAGMTPDDIIEAYKVLAQNVQDNAAREAARIGNAQRSLGTLAERVASPSGQTYGLANYTYDRTMRPVVDSTAKALVTQGLATGLQTNLSDALREAKNRYEDARNRATASSGGSGGGGTTGSNGNNGGNVEEVTDNAYYGHLADGGGGSSGGGGSTRAWGEDGSDVVVESSWDVQMGNDFASGKIMENEYRTYLRNRGFSDSAIDGLVSKYKSNFNFPM